MTIDFNRTREPVISSFYGSLSISDTICINFPFEDSKNGIEAFNRKPLENEKILFLTCKINDKKIIKKTKVSKFSTNHYLLDLKIIKQSAGEFRFGLKEKVQQGEIIRIDLFHYGDSINREPCN